MTRIHGCRHRSHLGCLLAALFLFVLAEFALASPTFVSGSVLESQSSLVGGRSLLQAKKRCPIDFSSKDYTIFTSRCKAPDYPAKPCCTAFKKFACPYAKQLNDPTTNCAATMFRYIDLYGHYPPGLFASRCREGNRGVSCPTNPA